VFRTITTEASSQTVLAAEARRIADAIVMICGVLDPALVVLGGGIGSYPQLLEPVCELTRGFIPDVTRIETTSLPNEAALYGALAVALRAAREQLFKRGTRGVLEAGRLT
jgi:predicted NBD/HSP70 family sugar kinase